MFHLLAGSLFLLFFCHTVIAAESDTDVDSVVPQKQVVFSSKSKAEKLVKTIEQQGGRSVLTIQKQPQEHYIILLKGYQQWSDAVKSAQTLEQQGFNHIEVSKGRFDRNYTVFIAQFLDKKKAGSLYNTLRSKGYKNVKVYTDSVNQERYIVTITNTKALKAKSKGIKDTVTAVRPKTDVKILQKQTVAKKKQTQLTKSSSTDIDQGDITEKPKSIAVTDAGSEVQDETLVIAFSDPFDVTYDINLDELEETDGIDWGGNFTIEEDVFTRDAQPASHSQYVHAASYLEWHTENKWDFRLAARLDGTFQHGDKSVEYNDLKFDYADSYIRYREKDYRITAGTQTIRWGRVDNLGPTDNMATLDFSRGVLPKWGENYRSSLALRSEIFLDKGKLDLVYLPAFRPAELSDEEDVWFPINFNTGRVLGFPSNPAMTELVRNATIDDDVDSDGGFGMRFSSMFESVDYAMTIQRVRLSAPYYSLNETIRQGLLSNSVDAIANANNQAYTFKEEHPENWIIGADAAFDWKAVTWRVEAAWFSDMPATTTELEYKNYHGFRWAGGLEFYPGDADTRVNLQISGHHINEKEKIIDLNNVVSLSGEVETLFSNNSWKLSGRFNIGLSDKDIYISPELAYLGWEPLEVYTAIHYLDGDEQTIGGFYENNNMLTFGVRGKF